MEQELILHSPGVIPGIPGGSHGPGVYLVDYDTHTIRPAPGTEAPATVPNEETIAPAPATPDVSMTEQEPSSESVSPPALSQEGQEV